MDQETSDEKEISESQHLLGEGLMQMPVATTDKDNSKLSYPSSHAMSCSGTSKKCVGRKWPWKKLTVYAIISMVVLAVSITSVISLPLSLGLTNIDHEDDTFVYTAVNNTSPMQNQVWLTTLSTFWYKSIEVGIKSSNVNDLHTARVYAVPLHEYHKTEVINETCAGGSFLPPKLNPGLQIRYLYAHLPFSYDGCITNPLENDNSIKFRAGIFQLSNKREFERYLHYMVDGNTTFALNITPVNIVHPGETKCVHLEMVISHTTSSITQSAILKLINVVFSPSIMAASLTLTVKSWPL